MPAVPAFAMNLRLFSIVLAGFAATVARVSADEDFILQEAMINGAKVTYKIPVSGDQGEVVSQPVDADTSAFRLITVYTDGNNQLKTLELDTKTIGTFVPSVEITLSSKDPSFPPRTRIDQAYGVQVKVENLSSNPADPLPARKVRVVRSYKLYDPETFNAGSNDPGKTYAEQFPLTENKTYHLSDGNPAGGILPRLDLMENPESVMMGEETYTAYAGDTNVVLASATIRIWPLATAEILGIETDRTYTSVPLEGAVKFNHLYPGSAAFVAVRIGDEDLIISSSAVNYSSTTVEPQTQQLPLQDLNQIILEDGVYLLKAYTITPFHDAWEELDALGFKYVRESTRKINGTVTTME